MGMFDSFYFDDPPLCVNGHALDGEWQTKDLDCILASFRVAPDGTVSIQHEGEVGYRGVFSDTEWTPTFTGEVEIGTTCYLCPPTFHARADGSVYGMAGGAGALLHIENGRVVRAETYADEWNTKLPPDDPRIPAARAEWERENEWNIRNAQPREPRITVGPKVQPVEHVTTGQSVRMSWSEPEQQKAYRPEVSRQPV